MARADGDHGRAGTRPWDVAAADALACVAGYAIGPDVTIRGPEERSMRKSPDSYAVLGPWLVTADELPDPNALAFELLLSGEPKQRSNTNDLSPIVAGDRVDARIEGIGTLRVAVR